VAYVERMAYEVLESLGAEVGPVIYAAGGGTRSAPWCQIRADVLGRALKVPAQSGGAMGAAIIAAGGTLYPGIVPAATAMVRIGAEYAPRPDMKRDYDERFRLFRAECGRRGYID
jgi:sugar (pentulose or hexulose) kinase